MVIEQLVVGPLSTNCYLVGDERTGEAVVIDPGGNVPRILDKLREHHWTLRYIVNTHGHMDHIAGNQELKKATGATLALHQADASMLTDPGANLSLWFNNRPVTSPRVDVTWQDGEKVKVGQLEFLVLHTPGHTPGSICLWVEGYLFAGDTLFAGSVGRTDLPGGDHALLLASIQEKVLPLPEETVVYPGHGPATTVGEEKRYNPFL